MSAVPRSKTNGTLERLLLTEKEVAAIRQFSDRTVRKMRLEGAIPSVRIGRCVRYKPDDVEQFIQRHRVVGKYP